MRQIAMFPAGQDLPLFSDSPIHVDGARDTPRPVQTRLPSLCPICLGTGRVIVRHGRRPRRCTCPCGQKGAPLDAIPNP